MISRETRRYRACLKKLHTIKCTRHKVPRCHHFDCIKAIKEIVYGSRKRKSKEVTPTVNIEELFRKLREPISYDERFSDDFPDEPTPILPAVVLSIPTPDQRQAYTEVERKLTLRELIARKAAA